MSALLCSSTSQSALGQGHADDASPSPSVAQVAQIVQAAHAAHTFNGVVVVLRGGRVQQSIAVGEANRTTHRPFTPTTVFRLASLTKQVTALLVMQQVQRGKLHLGSPVRDLLFLNSLSPSLTVRQLLQHVSGLRDPSDGPDNVVPPFYLRTGSIAALQQSAVQFCAQQPKREPGGNFEYNNCDYLMLGAVLEKVTGLAYPVLVEKEVIRPLHLASWTFTAPAGRDAVAIGYGDDGSQELPQNPATYGAAGALYSNALDVAKWDAALLDHRLLSPESTNVMFQADPKLYGEAIGSWSYDLRNLPGTVHVIERQGEIGGTRCLNLLVPAQQLAVVILANTERAELFNTYSKKGLGYDLLRVLAQQPNTSAGSPAVSANGN